MTKNFFGAKQEAGTGIDLGGNHHPMHMKESEEERLASDPGILQMRFELCQYLLHEER